MGKVKVIGYAQRTFYNNGIEYRNFSDNLVGQQFASDGGTPLFTAGNFVVTTNIDPKISKLFKTNKLSNFITLTSLDLSDTNIVLLKEATKVKLNLDTSVLTNYAYFGSLREFIRVSLEDIISNWTASIFVDPNYDINFTYDTYSLNSPISSGNTVEDYTYDLINNKSKFKCNVNHFGNTYDIIFMNNGSSINAYNNSNDNPRNLSTNYLDYVVSGYAGEYNILGYTGSTKNNNDYVYFYVDGNPFSAGTTNQGVKFHIKPNATKVNSFFSLLSDFGKHLLNRQTTPIYTSNFSVTINTDNGVIMNTEKQLKWPISDGYNLDFNSTEYVIFVNNLLKMADESDDIQTNLISRFLVSNSITDFDTVSDDDDDTGQKIDKTLKIYGREFDEIKRFADGLSLANVVTYNKRDNTPDAILKSLAKTMGWGLTLSLQENDFITSYLTKKESTYSGQSIGLTPVEAETEMWRRLIINTPWIWKSKGTRKAIEFLLKFIGTPSGLVRFNEYLYKATSKIDMVEFLKVLEINTGSRDITNYPVDDDGYPKTLPDNTNMYFQKGGLWYRETAGSNSKLDVLGGNNPHVGPYDGGYEYINQFRCLIPNFSSVTLVEETVITGSTNLFSNYNNGLINNSSGETLYIDYVDTDNEISKYFEIATSIIEDPCPSAETTNCGCEIETEDLSIRIDISKKQEQVFNIDDCSFETYELKNLGDDYGFVMFKLSDNTETKFINKPECCVALGFTPNYIPDGNGGYYTTCVWGNGGYYFWGSDNL